MDYLVMLLGLAVAVITIIAAMRHFIRPLEIAVADLKLTIVNLAIDVKAIDRKYDNKTDEIRRDVLMLSRDITRMNEREVV